jgi:hypothetical protein
VAERQIRELLDYAVADVTPRAADPVADVLRRERRQRHRLVAVVATVVVLLAAAAVATVPRFVGGEYAGDVVASASPTEPTFPVQSDPATPRVVGREVVAGGLVVPVPPGWQTVDDGTTIYCDVPPRTIAVGFDPVPGGSGKYCFEKPFMTVIGVGGLPGSLANASRGHMELRQLTLPGGQPAWFTTSADGATLGQRPNNVATLYLPWSGAALGIALDQADFAEIFPTIRTRPVTPSALKLPDKVTRAEMLGPLRPDRPLTARPRATDPAVIGQVLDRLSGLTEVVTNDEACATQDMATAALTLYTAAGPAMVVITLSDGCAQATSSLGGRVTVPRGFTDELWRLLGGSGTLEHAK